MEPTGQRFLLAVDVSGSMGTSVMGSEAVTARTASAAMAMLTARTEENYHIVGFSDQLVPLKIDAGMSLDSVCTVIDQVCLHVCVAKCLCQFFGCLLATVLIPILRCTLTLFSPPPF